MTLAALLKTYRPVAAPTRVTDPKLHRRNAFRAAVEERIKLLADPSLTRTIKTKDGSKQVAVRPWWTETKDGVVVSPRYGVQPLRLAPGCTALKLPDGDVKKAPDALAEAAAAGDLDAALAAAVPKAPPARKAKGKGPVENEFSTRPC
jgi:hypothetical protein